MKMRLWVFLLAGCVALPAIAVEKRTLVRLEGWIVDSHCGAKNANKDSTEDTLACVQKGARLLLVTSDMATYDLEDQERALEHAGKKVRVFGTVDQDRRLRVGNYIGSDKKDGKKRLEEQRLGLKSDAP